MGRPTKAEQQDTRAAILEAALELFGERGVWGTSMRQLARAVGVRESGLYHYFESKEDVFRALLAQLGPGRISQVLSMDLGEQAEVLGGREALRRLVGLVVTAWAAPQEQQLFRILMREYPRLVQSELANPLLGVERVRAQLAALLERLMRDGKIRPVDARATALLFIGPLLFLRVAYTASAKPDFRALEAESERLADQLWALLEDAPPAPPRQARLPRRGPHRAGKEG